MLTLQPGLLRHQALLALNQLRHKVSKRADADTPESCCVRSVLHMPAL